jgi:hypothetical protein
MKISNFSQCIFSACLTLLFVSSTSHAQIYKWVDANGQTHYSEKQEDAGKAKTEELKIRSQPTSTQANNSSAQYWQEQERQFNQRRVQKLNKKTYGSPVTMRPNSQSGGKSDDTDASRCNLAKDVISGAVSHRNGASTDKYDREVAENDIRTFCR